MTTAQSTKSPAASSPFDLATTIAARKLPFAPFWASTDGSLNSLQAYLLDAWQRSVLCLDTLRQRGNEQEKIAAEPAATVLRFEHEVLMSGRALLRPINYSLSRVVPPKRIALDSRKRPVVVVDPRAGQVLQDAFPRNGSSRQ